MEEKVQVGTWVNWRGKNRDIFDVITSRQSIRRYTDERIPDEYIDKILEAGRYAPTGENMQPWEVIVIRDPEVKRTIGQIGMIGTGSWATPAYALKKMQERFMRIEDPVERERVLKVMYSGQVSEFVGKGDVIMIILGKLITHDVVEDTSALIENMLLEAHSLGIGACWVVAATGEGQGDGHKLHRMLNIPPGIGEYRIMSVLSFGWPSETRRRPRPKKPVSEWVHWEKFGNKVKPK